MKHLFKSLATASAVALTALTAVAPIASASSVVEETVCITRINNEELYRLPCSFSVTTHSEGYEFQGLVTPGQSLDKAENNFAEHIFCPFLEGQRVVDGKSVSDARIVNAMGEYELTDIKCVYSNYQLGSVRIEYGNDVSREFGFLHRGVSSRFGF